MNPLYSLTHTPQMCQDTKQHWILLHHLLAIPYPSQTFGLDPILDKPAQHPLQWVEGTRE